MVSSSPGWPRDTQTEVVEVTNYLTGKTWMDRNLGASQAATSSTDADAYGDSYQWGRAADEHQKRTSGITSALSSSDTPGHGNFITVSSSPYDWRSPQNDNLWQDVNGTNNPCPSNYRLPTDAEWEAERQSWSNNNATGAFTSSLKLPLAGYRFYSNGSLYAVGYGGYYWSSTVDGTGSRRLDFANSNAGMSSGSRTYGYSVRCLNIVSPGPGWPRDTQTEVVEVINHLTGKTWMDRNLGATQAATSSTDANAYGDLYQWGRAADGHENRTSGTTSTLSSSDTPGHGDFIYIGSSPYDWRSPQNDNLWQGVNGTNNPCPIGYRLPTEAELNTERLSWISYDAAGAFASPLKLPLAGRRHRSDGSLNGVGFDGNYWSSTVDGVYSRSLYFLSSSVNLYGYRRADGYSVRCLKD